MHTNKGKLHKRKKSTFIRFIFGLDYPIRFWIVQVIQAKKKTKDRKYVKGQSAKSEREKKQ